MSGALVRHWCERCQAYRQGSGIRQLIAGAGSISSCATCGGTLRREVQRAKGSLFSSLLGSFAFPVGSLPVLLTWLGVSLLASFLLFVPFVGRWFALTLVVWYLFAIVRVTSLGHDDFGSVGYDVVHPSEWFNPLVRYALTILVALLPALASFVVLGVPGNFITYALAFVGISYLPAGFVVAAHAEGCLSPLNPTVAIRLIARIPGAYVSTLVALVVAAALGLVVVEVVDTWVTGSLERRDFLEAIVRAVPGRFLVLYAPSVMARMLGVMVRESSEEL